MSASTTPRTWGITTGLEPRVEGEVEVGVGVRIFFYSKEERKNEG
jgi:hypothetical protein